MEVSPLVWALTVAGIVGLLAFDFVFHVRKAGVVVGLDRPSMWSETLDAQQRPHMSQ